MTRSRRLGALVLDVGPRGVEVGVAGHHVAGLQDAREQQVFRGAALVGRDDDGVAEDVPDGVAEVIEVAAAGVGLVAHHESGPLAVAHGRGAAVGEQVHGDALGGHGEEVEPGLRRRALALLARHAPQRLDDLDAEEARRMAGGSLAVVRDGNKALRTAGAVAADVAGAGSGGGRAHGASAPPAATRRAPALEPRGRLARAPPPGYGPVHEGCHRSARRTQAHCFASLRDLHAPDPRPRGARLHRRRRGRTAHEQARTRRSRNASAARTGTTAPTSTRRRWTPATSGASAPAPGRS